MKKIILFATSPQDAIQWCEATLNNFDEIIWVLRLEFLNEQEFPEGVEYFATELFMQSDAYPAAHQLLKGE